MISTDLSRQFFLDVCARGTVHIRERGQMQKGGGGLLHVFSTDTHEQAESLRILHCRLDRYGSGLYTLNDPPKDVEGLGAVSEMFRQSFARMKPRAA